jgi:hypothetical protein
MFNLLCIIYICVYVWFHMFFCILFAIFIWGFLNFSSLEARCRVDSTIIEKRNCWPIPQLLAGIEPTRHSFYEFKGNPCQTFPCISNPIVTPRRGSNWQCDMIFQLEEIIRNHPNFLLSVSSCKCLRTGRTYTACLLLRTCLKGALMHRMSREMRFNRVHPMQSQDKQASCFLDFGGIAMLTDVGWSAGKHSEAMCNCLPQHMVATEAWCLLLHSAASGENCQRLKWERWEEWQIDEICIALVAPRPRHSRIPRGHARAVDRG